MEKKTLKAGFIGSGFAARFHYEALQHVDLEIGAEEDTTYYRKEGVHYVPKIRLEDLLLGDESSAGRKNGDDL